MENVAAGDSYVGMTRSVGDQKPCTQAEYEPGQKPCLLSPQLHHYMNPTPPGGVGCEAGLGVWACVLGPRG